MAKGRRPCLVPECKGAIEPGTREGRLVEWCPVCERRLLQLRALQAKLAALEARRDVAPAVGPLSDEALCALLPKRFVKANDAARLLKRSTNLVTDALKRGEIVHCRMGRAIVLVSRASAKAWSEAYRRRSPEGARTAAIVAALPREAAAAVSVGQLAAATTLEEANVAQWTRKHRARPELKRRAGFGASGRAILLFWWHEAEGAHA